LINNLNSRGAKFNLLNLSAAQLRKKAERCKAKAAASSNPQAKALLERVAAGWEQLAEKQAAIEKRKR